MGDYFVCSKTDPVVETKAGKVRGFRLNTTYAFHGIHYAEADRFQMPQPVKPWKGIKNALAYGYVCPLLKQDEPNMEVLVPHRYWPQDEHCQNLNVWTQSLDPGAKKPVMVWLHGGGFSAGSAIEHVAYEGDHLSEFGDVVVVSVNHRLNILGYLDLSPFGEKYKNSANAGNADMVAALQWVHDNIAAFGGDPENVTIFGQSGGGMKVATLMNTLKERTEAVKGIVDTIFSISSQTNLLALNASIESARAGEAGKGFAVVADQIRNLAEESRKETENIAKILEELSDGTNAASDAVTQSVEAAQVQNDMIQNASESFSGMSGNMSKMIENIEHMDSMLNSLKQANDRIVENIMQISATAEEVTAASTQAENLSNQNLENAENAQKLLTGVLSVSEKLNTYQAQE